MPDENTNWEIRLLSKGYGGVVRASKSQAVLWVLENSPMPLRSIDVAEALWQEPICGAANGVSFELHYQRIQKNLSELKFAGKVTATRAPGRRMGLAYSAAKSLPLSGTGTSDPKTSYAMTEDEWFRVTKALPPFVLLRGQAADTRAFVDVVINLALGMTSWAECDPGKERRNRFDTWVGLGIWKRVIVVADIALVPEVAQRLGEFLDAAEQQVDHNR